MFSKMTASTDKTQGFSGTAERGRWDWEYKKDARIAEPLSEEQYQELLTMTGPPQTA